MITILTCILIAAIALPFLCLAALAFATYFDLRIADRLLDALALSLVAQWTIGCLLNFVAGLAIAAIGVWLPIHAPTLVHWLMALILIPFGLWRTWRGFSAFPRGLR